MGINSPCYHCEERHPHCHSTCEAYAETAALYDAIRYARQKQNGADTYTRDQVIRNKSRKLKDRMRGRNV